MPTMYSVPVSSNQPIENVEINMHIGGSPIEVPFRMQVSRQFVSTATIVSNEGTVVTIADCAPLSW